MEGDGEEELRMESEEGGGKEGVGDSPAARSLLLYDLGETDGIFRREEEVKGTSGDLGRDNIIERDIGDIGDKGLDIFFF